MNETTAVPALLKHTKTVYDAMKAASVEVDGNVIYEGFLTKLFTECGLSVPQYTPVMRELMRMDCVLQLKRGGGPSPSQWQLLQSPDEELYEANHARRIRYGRNKRVSFDVIQQRQNDLNNRLLKIEQHLGFLPPEGE